MASAFTKLAEPLQRVIHDAGWQELRPIQAESIHAICDGDEDLIICASTASGKTEAAFLPCLSEILISRQDDQPPGIKVLYIAPLKALINDQHQRLKDLLTHTYLPVQSWHGDIPAHKKKAFRESPDGVLLITPESLESCFINYGRHLKKMFCSLEFVIIDELHAFVSDVRGVHLASLLSRLEQITSRRPRRLGLSATLADFEFPKVFLDRNSPSSVRVIEDEEGGRALRIGLRAYPRPVSGKHKSEKEKELDGGDADVSILAQELARVFAKGTNLIFTNSRSLAELLTEELGTISKRERWSRNPFLIHHGSLSKEIRADVESRLKNEPNNSVFCTSTLEMGIDIGGVEAVGQLSPPWSVSSLAQRLGRSGRKEGESAVLRMYAMDEPLTKGSPIDNQLRPQLLRCIALIELMLEGWLEPTPVPHLQLSTFIQQTLSILRQTGGTTAAHIYTTLCEKGIFTGITVSVFKETLRSLAAHEIIEQMPEGVIILAPQGERLTHDRDFYAAFQSSEDLTIRHNSETLGTLPTTSVPPVGENLIFHGRRWRVVDIDARAKLVEVSPTAAKKPPFFDGEAGEIHTVVRRKMHDVLNEKKSYAYLHSDAQNELESARKTFNKLGISNCGLVQDGGYFRLFPWTGTRAMLTLSLCAKMDGVECQIKDLSLVYRVTGRSELVDHLQRIVKGEFSALELAQILPCQIREKYDEFSNDELLHQVNSMRAIDLEEAKHVVDKFLVRHNNSDA